MHKRHRPRVHQFDYSACYFMIDLDELDQMASEVSFFSRNKFNLVSFYDKDYGDKSGGDLKEHARSLLTQAGHTGEIKTIKLLCLPRLFGYVFNPIAVYYCYGTDKKLSAIIYEVRNTFGEQHSYVVPLQETERNRQNQVHHCDKKLHVSPFFDQRGGYVFRHRVPDEKLGLFIRYQDVDGTPLLHAALNGQKVPMKSSIIVHYCLKFPLMTFKVIAGIHWEALKLWLKGLKISRKPPAPKAFFSKSSSLLRNLKQDRVS